MTKVLLGLGQGAFGMFLSWALYYDLIHDMNSFMGTFFLATTAVLTLSTSYNLLMGNK